MRKFDELFQVIVRYLGCVWLLRRCLGVREKMLRGRSGAWKEVCLGA
jgi:hypothetical protein